MPYVTGNATGFTVFGPRRYVQVTKARPYAHAVWRQPLLQGQFFFTSQPMQNRDEPKRQMNNNPTQLDE